MTSFAFGNAGRDGRDSGGWFLGHMIAGEGVFRVSTGVGVKWGVHRAGSPRKAWVMNPRATTLSVLIEGRFRVLFPGGDVLLANPGDYALWPPRMPHRWLAEEDSIVLTVRWPSEPGDSIEVPTPGERLDPSAPVEEHRP